jgi:hypothetical protein
MNFSDSTVDVNVLITIDSEAEVLGKIFFMASLFCNSSLTSLLY